MPITHRVARAHKPIAGMLNYLQSPLLLLTRLYWGFLFTQSGWGKLHRLSGVADFFASLGLPFPHATALFIGLLEFIGGILLALGVCSRLVSLLLFVNMSVALWTADREAVTQFFIHPDKFSSADPFTFWFASLLILIFGPGFWAVDTLLGRYFGRDEDRFIVR